MSAASGKRKAELLYAQGLLLRSAGKESEALQSFREGADAAAGFARYLNVSAIAGADN